MHHVTALVYDGPQTVTERSDAALVQLARSRRSANQGSCFLDALSAKLIDEAGFLRTFMSGSCTSAARLGAPGSSPMGR